MSSCSDSEHLRIVVIDDEPDVVMTLVAVLREEGYPADGFTGGAQGLRGIQHLNPDVVICDIAMAAPNGWDVAKQVRGTPGWEKRPLMIALSGRYTKGADRVLAQMSGFDFFLAKPCDPEVLIALIENEAA